MKKLVLLLLIVPAVVAAAYAQGIKPPAGVSVFAKGTGRTTGHVITLYVQNDAGFSQKVTIPAVAIPSEEGRQGYVVPEPVTVTVPANGSEMVPIRAYCTEHFLPAPAEGVLLPRSNTWNPESPLVTTVQQIIRTTTDLQTGGQLTTPYSGDAGKELESVVQQVVWVATAPPDKPFTAADFCERTKREFTTATGTPISALPPALGHGMAQIWDAVTKVGRQAGVPAFAPPPLPPAASALPDAPSPTLPAIINLVKVTGTGRTTGHIADLAVSNPTAEAILIRFGPTTSPAGAAPGTSAYIPPGGQYQPYVVPYLPHVTVPSGQMVTIPVQGFCTDVHKAPVPLGSAMPPISSWVTPTPVFDGLEPSSGGTQFVVNVPTRRAPALADALKILQTVTPGSGMPAPASGTGCPEGLLAPVPTIPGTDLPMPVPVNPETHPAVGVPLLLDAIQRIIGTYDELKPKGAITTPFSGNPDKEREAVIQQTFWMYTAALRGEPYAKQDFRANTIRQFEQNTGKTFAQTPQPQQEKMDQGVDDFWDSFEAVGAEAKILPRAPVPPKPVPGVDEFFNSTIPGGLKPGGNPTAPVPTNPRETVANPTEPPVLIKDEKNKDANCGCGKIKFDLHFFEMEQTAGGGWISKDGSMTSAPVNTDGNPGPASHEVKGGQKNLKKGARIGVKLRNVVLDCPCSDGSACAIYKDKQEGDAHAAALADLEKLKKQLEGAISKAQDDLKKAQDALAGDAKKQEALGAARTELETAEQALKEAQDAKTRFDEAKKAYDDASKAEKDAKGKDAKAAAKAAKEQAKSEMDAAKKATVSDTKMKELERKVKSAQDKIDKIEKPVKDAEKKLADLQKQLEEAQKKADAAVSGHPSVKDKDGAGGKDIGINWDNNSSDFSYTKDADNKKIEFSFYLGFYCNSTTCKPVQCGRTFVVKVEE